MKLAIFGYGGHAKEVASQINDSVVFYVDDKYSNEYAKPISKFDPKKYKIIVAVSNPKDRERIVKLLPKETQFFSFIHPTSLIMSDNIEIGEGSFIGAYSIMTTNIKIGKHTILNRGNHIGHDCFIGDFFSMMPGSIVSGTVNVGDRVYMGTNSTIIENKFISSDTTIGANTVIIENINTGGTYVGVPGKKIK
jgi:sugar O-acyltransferase (sialic acid O-acetyltransferase NeuD family)